MNDFLTPVSADFTVEPMPFEDDMGPVGGADIEEVYPVQANAWDDEEWDGIPSSVPTDELEEDEEEEDDDEEGETEDTGEDLTGEYDDQLVD